MNTDALKEERISIRAQADIKNLIVRAAAVSKMSVTDFLLKAACKEAEQVLQEHDMLILNNHQQRDWFLALLDNPPQPNKTLQNAAGQHRKHLLVQ